MGFAGQLRERFHCLRIDTILGKVVEQFAKLQAVPFETPRIFREQIAHGDGFKPLAMNLQAAKC